MQICPVDLSQLNTEMFLTGKGQDMENLAESLLELSWSDMDDFASRIEEIATDGNGKKNDPRYIAQCLLDWAQEIIDAGTPSDGPKRPSVPSSQRPIG